MKPTRSWSRVVAVAVARRGRSRPAAPCRPGSPAPAAAAGQLPPRRARPLRQGDRLPSGGRRGCAWQRRPARPDLALGRGGSGDSSGPRPPRARCRWRSRCTSSRRAVVVAFWGRPCRRRVDRRADQHRDRDEVEPQQHGDRRRQRPVDRPRLRGGDGQDPAQHEGAQDPADQRERRPGQVERPVRPDRARTRGRASPGSRCTARSTAASRSPSGSRAARAASARTSVGPATISGMRHDAREHRQHVEPERQGAGLDDPSVPAEPVHDRDGVDEDVAAPASPTTGRARSRPRSRRSDRLRSTSSMVGVMILSTARSVRAREARSRTAWRTSSIWAAVNWSET